MGSSTQAGTKEPLPRGTQQECRSIQTAATPRHLDAIELAKTPQSLPTGMAMSPQEFASAAATLVQSLLQNRGRNGDDHQDSVAEAGLVLQRKDDWIVVKCVAVTEQPDSAEPKKEHDGDDPEEGGSGIELGGKRLLD